ncbi:hypothetical protein, partial [Candidatus Methylacidithermus pantelleriae]|uniref:hypothetical protein n=1 Tax=Candidatus Methylacidithermus pantelleriae TaxID=2744239 RepID=UPI001BD2E357
KIASLRQRWRQVIEEGKEGVWESGKGQSQAQAKEARIERFARKQKWRLAILRTKLDMLLTDQKSPGVRLSRFKRALSGKEFFFKKTDTLLMRTGRKIGRGSARGSSLCSDERTRLWVTIPANLRYPRPGAYRLAVAGAGDMGSPRHYLVLKKRALAPGASR